MLRKKGKTLWNSLKKQQQYQSPFDRLKLTVIISNTTEENDT